MPTSKDTPSTLARIEETLAALCAEVAVVRAKVEALEGGNAQMTTAEIIEFLDGYRAAEALAASAFGAWIAVSETPCLRGGLRAVQMREAYHAKLFEERIKELGGSPKAELGADAEKFFTALGASDTSDAEKVASFVAAAGDPKIIEQLEARAARMNGDEETQFLLRCVIEDERASLALIHQAHELLCGS